MSNNLKSKSESNKNIIKINKKPKKTTDSTKNSYIINSDKSIKRKKYKEKHMIINPFSIKKTNSDNNLLKSIVINNGSNEEVENSKLNQALINFNENYDALVYSLINKKEYLSLFKDENNEKEEDVKNFNYHLNNEINNHLPRRNLGLALKLNKHSSKKIHNYNIMNNPLSSSNLNGILNESFEYSFFEKDNFNKLSKFFTSQVYKKYSILPKKEFCPTKQSISLDDEVFYDILIGRKKLLVIDLVDTLIRIKSESFNDSVIEDVMNELEINYSFKIGNKEIHIQLRPGLLNFLNKIRLHYYILLFTSSSKNYAEPILRFIDEKDSYFHMKLYQDSCTKISNEKENYYIKDLRIIKNATQILHNIVCVDDDLMSFAFNIENAIPIIPFSQNQEYFSSDDELYFLEKFLLELKEIEDVRVELSARRRNEFEEKMKKIGMYVDCI